MASQKTKRGKQDRTTTNYNSPILLGLTSGEPVSHFTVKHVVNEDSCYESPEQLKPFVGYANMLPEPESAFLNLSRSYELMVRGHSLQTENTESSGELPTISETVELIKKKVEALYSEEDARLKKARKEAKDKAKAAAKESSSKGKQKNGSKQKKAVPMPRTEPDIMAVFRNAVKIITGEQEAVISGYDRKVGLKPQPKDEHPTRPDPHESDQSDKLDRRLARVSFEDH